jgi:hypothetical protein
MRLHTRLLTFLKFGAACALTVSILPPSAPGAVAVGVKLGTLGVGVDVTTRLAAELDVRAEFNSFDYSTSGSHKEIEYNGKLKLATGGILLDWHPGGEGFRLSVGAFVNKNELGANRISSGGTYTINDRIYSAQQVGKLTGRADFSSFAPYTGLGFGHTISDRHHWSFVFDLGVLFEGAPRLTVRSEGPLSNDPEFKADLEAERMKIQKDVKDFRVYPVIDFGFAYRF